MKVLIKNITLIIMLNLYIFGMDKINNHPNAIQNNKVIINPQTYEINFNNLSNFFADINQEAFAISINFIRNIIEKYIGGKKNINNVTYQKRNLMILLCEVARKTKLTKITQIENVIKAFIPTHYLPKCLYIDNNIDLDALYFMFLNNKTNISFNNITEDLFKKIYDDLMFIINDHMVNYLSDKCKVNEPDLNKHNDKQKSLLDIIISKYGNVIINPKTYKVNISNLSSYFYDINHNALEISIDFIRKIIEGYIGGNKNILKNNITYQKRNLMILLCEVARKTKLTKIITKIENVIKAFIPTHYLSKCPYIDNNIDWNALCLIFLNNKTNISFNKITENLFKKIYDDLMFIINDHMVNYSSDKCKVNNKKIIKIISNMINPSKHKYLSLMLEHYNMDSKLILDAFNNKIKIDEFLNNLSCTDIGGDFVHDLIKERSKCKIQTYKFLDPLYCIDISNDFFKNFIDQYSKSLYLIKLSETHNIISILKNKLSIENDILKYQNTSKLKFYNNDLYNEYFNIINNIFNNFTSKYKVDIICNKVDIIYKCILIVDKIESYCFYLESIYVNNINLIIKNDSDSENIKNSIYNNFKTLNGISKKLHIALQDN